MNAYVHAIGYAVTIGIIAAFVILAVLGRIVRTGLLAFRRMQLRRGDRLLRSREEREAVMQAMTKGGAEAASRRMRAHLPSAAAALRGDTDAHGAPG